MPKYFATIDLGTPGGDTTVRTIFRKPTKFERLLRRLNLNKHTWELKLVKVVYEESDISN